MAFRACDAARDVDDIQRIWQEIGWTEPGRKEVAPAILAAYQGLVAELDGHVESFAFRAPGTLRHLDDTIPLCGIMAVGTSHIARKQGFAARLTSQAVATGVAEGALVATLGMFEQGFYNRLGFGTGAREIYVGLCPATLRVDQSPGRPVRLTTDDCQALHAARLNRMAQHGAVSFHSHLVTGMDIMEHKGGYGLGYRDETGELTHAMWLCPDSPAHGPVQVRWMAYRNYAQFLELLALLKALGDQFHTVRIQEPRAIQLQDLVPQPFTTHLEREGGKHKTDTEAVAWWQMRICDLPGCLERTHLLAGPVRFNLLLEDPIQRYLDDAFAWRGTAGEYTVSLGPESSATRGTDPGLPTLTATVNAFTRLWLGVRPATGLAVTDSLAGPPDLLAQLDRTLCLPLPTTDWGY